MGGTGIDLELWRARVGMFHAARCRSRQRGKGGRIPLVQVCLLALAVGMMVSMTPAVLNMLLLLGGDIELNPGPDSIHIAAIHGRVDSIRTLVKMGNASVDSCDEYGNTPLHYAALHGHVNVIRMLIELGCYTNKTGWMRWTALHFACKGGHSNVIRMLITENICHSMSVDDSGNSPIHIATKFGHSNLFRMLVTEFDYDINAAGQNGWTPLHYACQGGDINIVKMLIFELNCHPMKCNEHGNTPLHIAALKCNLDIVRLLLNSGYCANVRNKHGSTLLHAASTGGHSETVSILISYYGCDPLSKDEYGRTPLHCAAGNGHQGVIRLLVGVFHCDVNVRSQNGSTPLHTACARGQVATVRLLISEFGCNPLEKTNTGDTPLHVAAQNGKEDVIQLLVKLFGCSACTRGQDGRTPLHAACQGGHISTICMLLLEFECDIAAEDDHGDSPLDIIAAPEDLWDVIKLLASKIGGRILFYAACQRGRLETARFLVSECGYNPNSETDSGSTFLHIACLKGHCDVIRFLITECGCNPSVRGYNGMTALHSAYKGGHVEAVSTLLFEYRCSPVDRDDHAHTPLHIACMKGHCDVIKLFSFNFDMATMAWDENSNGDTPLEIAIDSGDIEIVKEFVGHVGLLDDNRQCRLLQRAYTSGQLDIFREFVSEFNCDPNTVGDDGENVLFTACEKKDFDMIHLLITECGCIPNVNYDDWECSTPLHLACKNKDLDMVHKLISDFDMDTMAWDENTNTPLEIAIDTGDMRIVREFVGHVVLLDNNVQCWLLRRAYRHGQWDIFRVLVSEFNCDPNAVDDNGENILFTACEKNDFDMVRLLITEFGCNPNVSYDDEWFSSTPLHLACKNKHVDMVHELISDFGVNTLVRDENGDTPLQIAIETGDMRIVKEFVGHSDMDNDDQYSHLRRACMSGHWDILRVLISDFGCDPNTVTDDGDSILHDACKNTDLDMVHKLISDFDVHTLTYNENGDTPLKIAIETGDVRIVKEFVGHTEMDNDDQYWHLYQTCKSRHWDILRVLISDFGCDPNTESDDGDSILRNVCEKDDWDMVRLLITEFGCDPKVNWEESSTPLHLACENKDLNMVHKLISDFDVHTLTYNENGDTPLQIAIETGDMRIVKEFVGHTDMDNYDQYEHLLCACMTGHWVMLRVLISDFGCDPNTVYEGDSILRDACENNDWDMVHLLITEFGCDPNVDYDGWRCITPLHLACENKDLEMVHRLISDFNVDSGVKFKDESEAFITPLELASRDGSMNIVKEFADYINTEDHPLACCYACEEGHLDVVRVLISELGFNPMGRNGLHPLNYACRRETNLNIVHMLISEYDVSINAKDKDGDTAMDVAIASGCINNVKELAKNANISRSQLQEGLRRASSNGHLEMVECLIVEFDVDPSSKNSDGDMPIHTAARHGHTKIVSMLINKYNISPVAEGHNMRTPLHEACASGSYDVFKLLVTIKNLYIQHRDTNSNTHLHTAAENGQLQMVKELKQLCAALAHTLNENLQTPLHLALMNGHKTIAELLLSQFNSQIVDVAGNSTLHLAAMCGYTEMVSKLIQQYECTPDCLNNKHQTPLHVALEKKYEQTADALLSKFQCCPTSVDINGNTPLHLAAAKDLPVMVRKLIDQYSSIPDCRNNKQETPLLLAAEAKNWTIVDSLVSEFDCCPMKVNVDGTTPLHCATIFGPTYIIQKMINKCASTPDCSNSKQETVLLLAAKAKNWTIVDTLLSKFDCYPMKADIDGNTPLHYTAMYGPTDINRKMIKHCKSSLDCVNGRQEIPLLLAAKEKNWEVVDMLLSEYSCSPTAVDAEGNTVLHVAAKNGSSDLVASLLSEYKVYSQPRNNSGYTPLYYASTNRHSRIVAELVKHNCNPATVDEDYKILEQISHRKLSEGSLTKIFVIGNKSAGKSTLIEALKNETQQDPYFNDKVASHTAGIVPSVHQSEEYGRVLFYDFAGDPEYYSSHAAALERLLTSSHHIFLLVVDFSEEEEAILQTLGYWLTFISYNSKDTQPKSQVIVVGSHADIIEAKGEDAKWKVCELFTEISSELYSHHPYTEMVGYCSLDCRTCECARIEKLYKLLKQCCLSPVSDESKQLSVGAIILLGVLQRDFKGVIACEVAQICMHIQLAELYLPQGLVSVYSYLQELNSQGVVLIVGNHEGLREEWVILDVSEFLATVHRKLFSSASLLQVCSSRLLSNVGIIPESDLRNVLAQFDIGLLQQCLKYLQYCFEVDDSEVLQSIFAKSVYTQTAEAGTNGTTDSCTTLVKNCATVKTCATEHALLDNSSGTASYNSKLLFFPALLRGRRSEMHWYEESPACCKGWYIECAGEYDYFPPRFLHVLLLRLAFTFTLPAHNTKKKRKNLDLFSRRCNMWKNGIYWLMQTDVECMVEVVKQNKALVVIVRSKKEFEADCACMFSNIIIKVLEARQDFCHSLAANAYLIHPDDLNQTFLPRVEDLHLFDMAEIKRALSNNENSVVSVGEQNFKRLSLSRLQTHSLWNILFPEVLTTCEVLKYINPVVGEWFLLGLKLGVPESALETIEYNHSKDVETCKRKMIQEWLKRPCPSWCSLEEAMKAVGLKHAANEISKQCLETVDIQRTLQNKQNADTKITDEFIKKFTTVIGSMWPLLACFLSFTTAEIEQIKREVTGVPSVKATDMMNKWRERATATYGTLMIKLNSVLEDILYEQVAARQCSSPQEDSQSHRSHKRKAPEDDDQPVIKRKTPDTWRPARQEESSTSNPGRKRSHPDSQNS